MRICVMIIMAYDSRAPMMTVVSFVCTCDVYAISSRVLYNTALALLLILFVDQQFLVCSYTTYIIAVLYIRYNIMWLPTS